MLPVLFADPLWWVAARLRRILTGLLVLALSVGAHGQAAVAAPAGDTALVAAPAATVLPASVAPPIAMSTGTPAGVPTREAQPRRVRAVDAEFSPAEVIAPVQPDPTGRIHPVPDLPDPVALRSGFASDERQAVAYHAASPGQRAPPAH